MNIELQQDQIFAISESPWLTFVAPVIGVLSAIVLGNIAYRLWQANLINPLLVVLLTVVPMILVSYWVWQGAKGQVRLQNRELVIDHVLFFDRRVRLDDVNVEVLRWLTGKGAIPNGLQLRVSSGSQTATVGVLSRQLMDSAQVNGVVKSESRTIKSPHAVLSEQDFVTLMNTFSIATQWYEGAERWN